MPYWKDLLLSFSPIFSSPCVHLKMFPITFIFICSAFKASPEYFYLLRMKISQSLSQSEKKRFSGCIRNQFFFSIVREAVKNSYFYTSAIKGEGEGRVIKEKRTSVFFRRRRFDCH